MGSWNIGAMSWEICSGCIVGKQWHCVKEMSEFNLDRIPPELFYSYGPSDEEVLSNNKG